MGKFRMVHTAFWEDPTVGEEMEMTPEDSYFFIFAYESENDSDRDLSNI